jgi:hypothetical protein
VHSGRTEATLVARPRGRLEETLSALQQGDLTAARAAFAAYDQEWNGIEVYVNFRSRELYGEIESDYEADIERALEQPAPDLGQLIAQLQAMLAKYDEAIVLSDTGPPISPVFDDVARIRIARAPLRTVPDALKAADVARARALFGEFQARWPEVRPLFDQRSADTSREVDAALGDVDRALMAPSTDPTEAAGRVNYLLDRFNFGLNLVNAAARNADLARTGFSAQDVTQAAELGALGADLDASLSRWTSRDYQGAGDLARRAGQRFERVLPALQAKGNAEMPVRRSLDAYTPLTDGPGDPASVRSANRAAIESAAIAQQALVGQFWTDPAFQSAYQQAVQNL